MNNLWLKIRVWTKVVVFVALLSYALFFVINNNRPTMLWVWFFRDPLNTSLLLVVIVSFGFGVLGTILVRTTIKTVRQIRDLRQRTRTDRLERELAHQRVRASMLRARPEGEEPGEVKESGGVVE